MCYLLPRAQKFCPQEQAADKFRYITYGTLDDPEKLPPKGEFFCKDRASWMSEIPGMRRLSSSSARPPKESADPHVGVFHKQQIKE